MNVVADLDRTGTGCANTGSRSLTAAGTAESGAGLPAGGHGRRNTVTIGPQNVADTGYRAEHSGTEPAAATGWHPTGSADRVAPGVGGADTVTDQSREQLPQTPLPWRFAHDVTEPELLREPLQEALSEFFGFAVFGTVAAAFAFAAARRRPLRFFPLPCGCLVEVVQSVPAFLLESGYPLFCMLMLFHRVFAFFQQPTGFRRF